jgi:hypothetical protein
MVAALLGCRWCSLCARSFRFGDWLSMITRSANKTVQATPTNAAVWHLRPWAGLCDRYGVPDLGRWTKCDL